MASHSPSPTGGRNPDGSKKPCALFWDESLLWGVMAVKALEAAGLPFVLLTAGEVRRGALAPFRMLFVPGGWASNKLAALGGEGCAAIRRFVIEGGNYLGICGGAGLATREGLALLSVGRRPTADRVASFSGPIRVSREAHPLWQGIEVTGFSAWWPSQLAAGDSAVRVLAAYAEALPGAFSSDIPVERGEQAGWPALEARYGILLDPRRMRGEPAVIEGRCGAGKVLLSMLHFDTPGDRNGKGVLHNLWRYLAAVEECRETPEIRPAGEGRERAIPSEIQERLTAIGTAAEGLIRFGEDLSLWQWRNPYLLRWRRGVRGLEYGTLAVLIREIGDRLLQNQERTGADLLSRRDGHRWEGELKAVEERLCVFVGRARELLERESWLLDRGPLSPLQSDDRTVQALREELFGAAMRHGGTGKALLDALGRLWFSLVRNREEGRRGMVQVPGDSTKV